MLDGMRRLACIALVVTTIAGGCAARRGANPSFNVTADEAQRALREMERSPRPLSRPVVVLDGMGPPLAASHLAGVLRRVTGDDRIVSVQFAFCGSLDACRRRAVAAVEKQFPSDDPNWTTEVDVIGISMGGVVGRNAAAPLAEGQTGKRLKVARLFTISSPHRGALMAALPPLIGPLQLELRQDSRFLRSLSEREDRRAYELVSYARLGDWVVGDANTAPEGVQPHWVPTPPLQDAHLLAFSDARIVADIARRLRDEPPFATDPPVPLP
jgi:pimeloyl-ACP methyl ester carboxylesterase